MEVIKIKRVLHVLRMNKMSGAEKVALLLCKNMKEYEPIVVCGEGLKDIFNNEKIKNYQVDLLDGNILISAYKLKKIINKNDIYIVHAHDNVASVVSYMAKWIYRLDIKIISHIHNCYPWLENKSINKRIDRKLRKKYDYNIACGKVVYDFYKKNAEYFQEEKTCILSNAMDINLILSSNINKEKSVYEEFAIPKNKVILGFVGRLDEQKGIVPFIREISKNKDDFKDCRILLVGNGSLEDDIKRLIKDNNLEELFILTGFQEDIYKFYGIIDILFLPSLYEGLPMVILEAMAFKKPIISMNVGSISEVVIDGYNGKLVKRGEYDVFIHELLKLSKDSYLVKRYGENSYNHVNENFNINRYVDDIVDIYNKVGEVR